MNKNTTKRSLLASVLALMLCMAMLVGTTFAWFTDTASTGVNKIQAGNLDIEVSFAKEAKNDDGTLKGELTEFKTIENATDVFDNNALWEPGRVEYVVFKIENKGNLALKYKFNLAVAGQTAGTNVAGQAYMLADYLCASAKIDEGPGYVGSGYPGNMPTAELNTFMARANDLGMAGYSASATPADKPLTGVELEGTLEAGKFNCICMAVWMPTTVGNEANAMDADHAATIDLGINVVATQYTYENDSFGNTYDENATYPVVNAADFSDAITSAKDGDVIALTGPVDFADETVSLDKDITISGDDAVIKNALFTVADGKTVAFDGVTVSDTVTIRALNDASLKFTDCEFNITPQSVNSNKRAAAIVGNHQNSNVDLTLEGCTFKYNYTAGANEDLYNMAVFMWSNVENVLIKNCQFNDYGFVAVKFLEMKAGANIVFEGNTFNMSCRTDSNWYYNTAVQIHTVNQPTGACHVSFINNVYSPHNTGVPDPQPESPRHGRHRSPKEEEAPCPCM